MYSMYEFKRWSVIAFLLLKKKAIVGFELERCLEIDYIGTFNRLDRINTKTFLCWFVELWFGLDLVL